MPNTVSTASSKLATLVASQPPLLAGNQAPGVRREAFKARGRHQTKLFKQHFEVALADLASPLAVQDPDGHQGGLLGHPHRAPPSCGGNVGAVAITVAAVAAV